MQFLAHIRLCILPNSLSIRVGFTEGRASREPGGDGGGPSCLLLDLSHTVTSMPLICSLDLYKDG